MRAWLRSLMTGAAFLAFFVIGAAPRIAEACPFCAGTNDGGVGRYIVIGAMVITPFLAVAICVPLVIRAVRRTEGTDQESSGNE